MLTSQTKHMYNLLHNTTSLHYNIKYLFASNRTPLHTLPQTIVHLSAKQPNQQETNGSVEKHSKCWLSQQWQAF